MIGLATILVGLLTLVIVLYLQHLYKFRSQLTTNLKGLPFVKPLFFFLGSPPYAIHKLFTHDFQCQQHKKYGKTFVRFDGVVPVISTIDPKLIKAIMIEKAEHFSDILGMEVIFSQHICYSVRIILYENI